MKDFKTYLIHQNLSKNTIESYQSSVNYYFKDFEEIFIPLLSSIF